MSKENLREYIVYTFILKVIKNIREKCIKFILKRDVIRIFS